MISVAHIEQLVGTMAEGSDLFPVKVTVATGNRIRVLIDRLTTGITMKDCVDVHRHIESAFDREVVDFELEVGSPGMEEPFVHHLQYVKNVGRQVRVVLTDGVEHKGRLNAVLDSQITLLPELPRKGNNKAGPAPLGDPITIELSNIKETKKIITFK